MSQGRTQASFPSVATLPEEGASTVRAPPPLSAACGWPGTLGLWAQDHAGTGLMAGTTVSWQQTEEPTLVCTSAFSLLPSFISFSVSSSPAFLPASLPAFHPFL